MKIPVLFSILLSAALLGGSQHLCAEESEDDPLEAAREAFDEGAGDTSAGYSLMELLERRLAAKPGDAALLGELGLTAVAVGDRDRAAAVLSQIQNREGLPRDLVVTLGAFLAMSDEEAGREESLRQELHLLQPTNVENAKRLAVLLQEGGKKQEAVALYKMLVTMDLPPGTQAGMLVDCALSELALGDWRSAAESVRRANSVSAKTDAVLQLLPAFERLGATGVEKLASAAAALASGEISSAVATEAIALLLKADHPAFRRAALPFAREIARREPSSVHALLQLGGLLSSTGRPSEAASLGYMSRTARALTPSESAEFQKLDARLKQDPTDLPSSLALLWRLNEIRQFLLVIERATALIAKIPDDARLHAELAYARLELEQLKPAEESALKAVEIDPRSGSAFRLLGRARLALADFEGAATAFEKSLELENNASARRELERIRLVLGAR